MWFDVIFDLLDAKESSEKFPSKEPRQGFASFDRRPQTQTTHQLAGKELDQRAFDLALFALIMWILNGLFNRGR